MAESHIKPWAEVGEILERLRRRTEMTQLEVAESSQRFRLLKGNFAERTLRRWEGGDDVPSVIQLYTVTAILELQSDDAIHQLWAAVRLCALRQSRPRSPSGR